MTGELPADVRVDVLRAFYRNHTDEIMATVAGFTGLGDGGYRVRLTYRWAGLTFTPEYRYIPPAGDEAFAVVREIAGYHGDKECWGAFCTYCGWGRST